MTIIAFAIQKGGVGKTSLCLHTAGALAQQGKKILIVDMDAQGSLSDVFIDDIYELKNTVNDLLFNEPQVTVNDIIYKTKVDDNISILPTNLTMADLDSRVAGEYDSQTYLSDALHELENHFDYVLIDCPPHFTSAVRMSVIAAHYVLIPVECHRWSFIGLNTMLSYINRVKKRANPRLEIIGLAINKYTVRRGIEQRYNQEIRKQYDSQVFDTEIRNHAEYVEAAAKGLPITHYLPNSTQANEFRKFATEVLDRVQAQNPVYA